MLTQRYILLVKASESFEVSKNMKVLKLEGNWGKLYVSVHFLDKPRQNILRKVKKPSKVRQNPKTLIPAFGSFLSVCAQISFLQEGLNTELYPYAVLKLS